MLVWHKLSIHFRLTAKFDGLKNACMAQTLHPLRCFLCMDGGYSQKCSDNPHPFQATHVSDGYNAQKHQNWPHPFSNQDISDGRPAQKHQNWPHPFSNQDISDGRTAQNTLTLPLTDPASESRRPAPGALLPAVGRHHGFLRPLPLSHKK